MLVEPWKGRVDPFCIFGNLYFIGTVPASSRLIDTGDGLILIDTGYPQTAYLIIQSIWELGFKPADIRYIVHSHGHYDHTGATRALVELTGAKTFIGSADADMVSKPNNLNWASEHGYEFTEFFQLDVLLENNDTVNLGNTCIRCVSTPGHTAGTLSFFFDAYDGKKTLRVGMHGGVGMNSMNQAYLKRMNLPPDMPVKFLHGLELLQKEHVDIFIGNHVGNNDTIGKAEILKNNPDANPFIDESAWSVFLDNCRKKVMPECVENSAQEV